MRFLPSVSRERMVDRAFGQVNKPAPKGFAAIVFGFNNMEAMDKFAKKKHDRNFASAQEKNF